MRVGFLVTSAERGGTEQWIETLARRLDRRAVEPVAVLTVKGPGPMVERWKAAGLEVRCFGWNGLPPPWAAFSIRRAAEAMRCDLLHCFNYRAVILGRLAKAIGGKFRLISSLRSDPAWFHGWLRRLFRWTWRWDDLYLDNSENGRRRLTQWGYPPERIRLARGGVATTAPPADRAEIRRRLGIPEEAPAILYVGRFRPEKGVDLLVRAAGIMVCREAIFFLVGDGPQEEQLKQQVRAAGWEDRFRFVGFQEDLGPWFSAADIFALPSRVEGMSNALLAAMAAGLPCVATAVGGNPEVLAPREVPPGEPPAGLLVPPENVPALAAGLDRLASRPELRRELGERGRKVAARFSLEEAVEAHRRAYEEIGRPG